MSEIVQVGAPVLRARAAEVAPEHFGTAALQSLVDDMIATMRAAPGVGLAAPQIGVPLRVIVLEDRDEYIAKISPEERAERMREPVPVRAFVNPTLTVIGTERALFFEGCLSVHGFVALVDRAAEVEVRGFDVFGQPQVMRARGWAARILQHECDHIDGTLYVDRMLTRSLCTGDRARALFAGKSMAEVLEILGERYADRPPPR